MAGREAPPEAAYVIPRPHEIAIERRCSVPGVRVVPLGAAAASAAVELEAVVQGVPGDGDADALLIVVGLVGGDGQRYLDSEHHTPPLLAQRLGGLPNSDQAYCIAALSPQEKKLSQRENRLSAVLETEVLHVCALDPAGLFYGALTLAQLFRPALAATAAAADALVLDLPLPTVVDWPDTEERGVWNGPEDQPWMLWKVRDFVLNLMAFKTRPRIHSNQNKHSGRTFHTDSDDFRTENDGFCTKFQICEVCSEAELWQSAEHPQ